MKTNYCRYFRIVLVALFFAGFLFPSVGMSFDLSSQGGVASGSAEALAYQEISSMKTAKAAMDKDISAWQSFYKTRFNLDCDFSKIIIPEKPSEGNWRLLIIIDVTLEDLYVKCKGLFPCWRWTGDRKYPWPRSQQPASVGVLPRQLCAARIAAASGCRRSWTRTRSRACRSR